MAPIKSGNRGNKASPPLMTGLHRRRNRLRETQLFQRLKMNLEGCQMTRLESRASLGVPDILVAWREGIFSTIETKVVKSGLKVSLSAHQVSWHMRTAEVGCPSHIVVAVLEAAKRPAALKVYRAGQARDLALHGLRVEPVADFPLSHVPWHVLRDCLLT